MGIPGEVKLKEGFQSQGKVPNPMGRIPHPPRALGQTHPGEEVSEVLTDHLEGFPVEGQVAVPGWEGGAILLLQALPGKQLQLCSPNPCGAPGPS